jgi:hypothetical protein
MVVCDVTSETKDVVRQLEDAQVNVLHRSRTKKDSSDEVLRQQMRKVVDTSSQPGRIVLISGSFASNAILFDLHLVFFPGDSDFSTDLNSFRYTKLWEIVLIHNPSAKKALKMIANHAFSFDAVIKHDDAKADKKVKGAKETKKKNKEVACVQTCKAGPHCGTWYINAWP